MGQHLAIDMILSLVDKISGPLKRVVHSVDGIGDAADRSARKFTRLQNQVDKLAKSARQLDAVGKPLATIGAIGAAGITATVVKFAELEEAQARLKTNLMDVTGKVGPEYEKLTTLAEKLGAELPGSTKDMIEMFAALREQGVQTNVILGGMGEAAAKFAVIMNVPFAEAATHVAKLSEAMGVADTDTVKFMDTLQRLKSAGGVNVQDLTETFKYSGAAMKSLRIQGLQAGWDVSAAIGMMATSSIEGSQAGTNFAMALSRMAEVSSKLDAGKIKKLVAPILDSKGIDLNFFDKKGNFTGIRGMIKELEKLRAINPQEQLLVLTKLFGQEAARPLSVFIDKGVKGFDEMTARMKAQADMQQKISTIMGTTKMQWETMTGTIGNVAANVGGVFARLINLPSVLARMNSIFEKMNGWILAHPKTAAVLGGIVASLTAISLVVGGLFIGIAAIGAAVGPFLGGLAATARIIGTIGGAIRPVFAAFRALSLILALIGGTVAIPVIIAVTAIAAAGLLIYKYWKPISGFFKGLFAGIAAALKPLEPLWTVFKNAAISALQPIIKPLQRLWQGLKNLLSPVDDVGGAAEKMGKRFGLAIGGMFTAIVNLTSKMFSAGANIVKMLWDGIMSMASKPVEAIKNIAQKIRNHLPFSPAKEGPLRDIHRVRIVETIAESMKPGPMVKAMRMATTATMTAVSAAPSSGMAAHSGSGGSTINFSPVINIAPGNGPEVRQQVDQALSTAKADLERMIDKVMAQKQRRAF